VNSLYENESDSGYLDAHNMYPDYSLTQNVAVSLLSTSLQLFSSTVIISLAPAQLLYQSIQIL